jgi:hypothetical protein
MLTHHRIPVCLSFISTDFPICNEVETIATLYPRDQERYHLLLTEPVVRDREDGSDDQASSPISLATPPRLLWFEFSPYRVTMTMQGNGQFSYRHLLEPGIYGLSRYWLHSDTASENRQLCLRNYTRNLVLKGKPLPDYLRIEYELWSEKTQLGHYVLNLEIHH